MSVVAKEMLNANNAVFRVAEWLSRGGCLVRPVASDTDIGIDLYCETVKQNRPFLHFWVQVKTGKAQIHIRKGRKKAAYDFKKKHLAYWSRQPIPVFAFLVPSSDSQVGLNLYVVNLTMWLVFGKGPTGHGQRLESHETYTLTDVADSQRFLEVSVPIAHTILGIREGVSKFVPDLYPGYERRNLQGYRARYALQVVEQVRNSCGRTLSDLLALPSLERQQEDQVRLLGCLLRRFARRPPYWKRHWEDFKVLGDLAKWRGKLKLASMQYEESKSVILDDKEIDSSSPSWDRHLKELDTLIAECSTQ